MGLACTWESSRSRGRTRGERCRLLASRGGWICRICRYSDIVGHGCVYLIFLISYSSFMIPSAKQKPHDLSEQGSASSVPMKPGKKNPYLDVSSTIRAGCSFKLLAANPSRAFSCQHVSSITPSSDTTMPPISTFRSVGVGVQMNRPR